MTAATGLNLVRVERWDDRRWRWLLRDLEVLPRLTPAECKVLLLAYCLADLATGEFDLPVGWAAGRVGFTERAVRDAVGRLVAAGLFERAGTSPQHGQIRRYALGLPQAIAGRNAAVLNAPAPGSNADPEIGVQPRKPSSAYPEAGRTNPGSCVPKPRKPASPKASLKATQKSCSSKRQRDAQAELFAPVGQDYDAAAAALLARIFSKRKAHGLVCRYRPKVGDVRVVLANAAAWRWAARRGNAKPMHSLPGFVRACLRDGLFNADDRLLALRDQGARRAAAATARRRQRAEAHAQAQAQAREQAARERAAAALEAMTPAQRAELWARVRADVQQRTPLIAERVASWNVETSHPARTYCVGHLMREGINDGTTERTHAARADGDGPRLNIAGQQSG